MSSTRRRRSGRDPDAEITQHVAALVLALLRAGVGALEEAGATAARAVRISRAASSTVTLALKVGSKEEGRSLIVKLTSADRGELVEVSIVNDEGSVLRAIGSATVDRVDLAQVALALARAGTARLAVVLRSESAASPVGAADRDPEP